MNCAVAPLVQLALEVDGVVGAEGEDDAWLPQKLHTTCPLGAVVAIGAGQGPQVGTGVAHHTQVIATKLGRRTTSAREDPAINQQSHARVSMRLRQGRMKGEVALPLTQRLTQRLQSCAWIHGSTRGQRGRTAQPLCAWPHPATWPLLGGASRPAVALPRVPQQTPAPCDSTVSAHKQHAKSTNMKAAVTTAGRGCHTPILAPRRGKPAAGATHKNPHTIQRIRAKAHMATALHPTAQGSRLPRYPCAPCHTLHRCRTMTSASSRTLVARWHGWTTGPLAAWSPRSS